MDINQSALHSKLEGAGFSNSGGGPTRRSFLKRSGGATAATFLAWQSSSRRASAEIFDPSPSDGWTQIYWGVVVKETPEVTDPQEVVRGGAGWINTPDYPIVGPEFHRHYVKYWFDAQGSDKTPVDMKRGEGSVSFGGTLKSELVLHLPEVVDENNATVLPDRHIQQDELNLSMPLRTWKINHKGEIIPPAYPGCNDDEDSNEGKGRGNIHVALGSSKLSAEWGYKVQVGGGGGIEAWGFSANFADGWRSENKSFKFVWRVVRRKTTVKGIGSGKSAKILSEEYEDERIVVSFKETGEENHHFYDDV